MKKLYSQLPAQGRIPIYFDGLSSAVFFLTPMNLLMATGAKAPKIALVIRTVICDGLHMMYQGCHGSFAQPKALFAKWMRRDVSVTHLSPSTSISLMLIVATGEMLIMSLHQAPMFLAVSSFAVGQVWAATVAAGAFRFRWHGHHLDFGHEKSPVRQKVNEGQNVSTFEIF